MYTLNGTTIKAPNTMEEENDSQMAENRTLDGTIHRDIFGSNKRKWTLEYSNTKKTDYDTINTIYQAYLANSTTVAFVITETNYPITSTNVHVDLQRREFRVGGEDYISDFTLILTED